MRSMEQIISNKSNAVRKKEIRCRYTEQNEMNICYYITITNTSSSSS